jgi:hypothetical protein
MSDTPIIWRVNRRPRITALEMGEYMATDDRQRETMRRNLKYERVAPSILYSKVHDAVAGFLSSPTRDRGILARCRELLEGERDRATAPQQRENAVYALASLATFESSLNALPINGMQLERPPRAEPHTIGKVRVSIQPTVLVKIAKMRGHQLRGAILVDPAKGIQPKSEELKRRATTAMAFTSMLLHEHVSNTGIGDGERASPAHCLTFHTHRQELVPSPANYRKQLAIMQAACRTMAGLWESIDPPPSYEARYARFRD